MNDIKCGSIIQANENAGKWCGSVLIVEKVKSWGVLAFLHIPGKGDAFIRLRPDQFDDLHAVAVLVPVDYEDE